MLHIYITVHPVPKFRIYIYIVIARAGATGGVGGVTPPRNLIRGSVGRTTESGINNEFYNNFAETLVKYTCHLQKHFQPVK